MHRTFFTLAATLVSIVSPGHGADFDWVTMGGGAKNDKTRAVTVDREGNVLLAGELTGDGVCGDQKASGGGGMDFFIAKLDPTGRCLWMHTLGGSGIDRGYGVVTDAVGNAYVTGHFQSTDAKVGDQMLPNAGDYDVFVAKYSPTGEQLWVRTAGGAGYDYGHGIALDRKGDVIVAGAVAGEAAFGNQTVGAKGARCIFCAKYSADGDLKWARGTEGRIGGSAHGVGVDAANNIYIGGNVSGVGSFGGLAIDAGKTTSALLLKVSSEGKGEWFRSIPGTPSALSHEISVDAEGRTWLVGMFKGTMTAGADTFSTTGDKDSDGFVSHYDAQGALQWTRVVQGPGTDYCLGVCNDGQGAAWLTGEFTAIAQVFGQALTSRGITDIYVASLDVHGKCGTLNQAGGEKNDNAYTAAWDAKHRAVVIAGACNAPVSFGGKSVAVSGGADFHAARMRAE
ncbi:MAG: hypothetical protein H7A55_18760 [Verrucomicrobiaceae bacterium]|nr:hypothetical protein [Verrucomicrobiaceae bacterium]